MKKIVLAVLLLSGCSGLNYAMENYQSVKPITFNYAEQQFRIFDKPTEGRLMITPSIGGAMASGATFGLAGTAQNTFKSAALAYLSSTGRNCNASEMMLVVEPQWETFYTCS